MNPRGPPDYGEGASVVRGSLERNVGAGREADVAREAVGRVGPWAAYNALRLWLSRPRGRSAAADF